MPKYKRGHGFNPRPPLASVKPRYDRHISVLGSRFHVEPDSWFELHLINFCPKSINDKKQAKMTIFHVDQHERKRTQMYSSIFEQNFLYGIEFMHVSYVIVNVYY